MKHLFALISLAFFTMPSLPQMNGTSKPSLCDTGGAITVNYCDLIRNPKLYDQKLVRIQAVYRYGYEWSELYCPGCLTEDRTWVDFDESSETCTRPEVARNISDNGFRGRTVNVVLVGKFYGSGGGYGHMNTYKFKLVVSCVKQAKIILNDSPVPNAIPKKLLHRATCHTPGAEKK